MPEVQTPPEGANTPTPQQPQHLQQPLQPEQQQPVATTTTKRAQGGRRVNRAGGAIVRFIVWLIVTAAIIVIALVVTAYLAKFDSVFEMLDFIQKELNVTLDLINP